MISRFMNCLKGCNNTAVGLDISIDQLYHNDIDNFKIVGLLIFLNRSFPVSTVGERTFTLGEFTYHKSTYR